MPFIALQNLGCNKNTIDGERIAYLFSSAGYDLTDDFTKAEVIVVNTCAFIREAQEEAIEAIMQMAQYKTEGCCKTLVVSGCFSQRYRDKVMAEVPEVDLWVGVRDWQRLIEDRFKIRGCAGFKRKLSAPIATQHLKIAEGCSHACTYCIIPRIRGRFRSRPVREIIAEARWLEEQGVRELILVAQDTSYYGKDTGSSLPALLETLLAKTSFPWIRLMYLHPGHVDDALLRLMASEKRLCPYFDMPLQHIANPILKAMNRRPLSSQIDSLIEKIRSTVPAATLRSTFILGFPGEDATHFNELIHFIERTKFDKLGVFPYSPEEGTRAYAMRPRPRQSTVAQRCETIMLLQREISRELLATKVGTIGEVIIDGPSEDPAFGIQGRTRADAPEIDGKVLIKGDGIPAGSIIRVKITDTGDYDSYGEPIHCSAPRSKVIFQQL